MWILLFTMVLATAICLGVAAILLGPMSEEGPLDRSVEPREPGQGAPDLARTAFLQVQPNTARLQTSDDVRLLLGRMAVLELSPYQVNGADPLLFRELQGRCSLCASKGPCALDLAREAADGRPCNWRAYCPNAASLALLSGPLLSERAMV